MKNVPDAPTAMICPPIVEVTAIKEKLLPVTREKRIEGRNEFKIEIKTKIEIKIKIKINIKFKMLQLNKGIRVK